MNNPDDFPINVEEQRQWLIDHKARKGLSWSVLADLTGIAAGTISPFGGGSYAGRGEPIAKKIFRYRQMLDSQQRRTDGLLTDAGWFETPTSRRIRGLLVIAQMGRITVGATGPGTGKTVTMRDYANKASNVWIATMKPTTKTLNAMIGEVLKAVGGTPKGGWTRQLSAQVADNIAGRRGLLVIDEANHLDLEAIEEIRAWHDATEVGICLLGNEELMMRIRGGPRRDAFARLNSRIAASHLQNLPVEGDVAAFCDAWKVDDGDMRRLLTRVALTPGAGGLRECRQIVESASMIAADEHRHPTIVDLREAMASRSTTALRGVA